ncbi:MAG: hypothetical protein L6V81_06990 [Clostridium sp.]|nr:MAG: hypothetical protein L6V81_06990 [Clostridium sp.]
MFLIKTNTLPEQSEAVTGSYEYTLPYEIPHVVKEEAEKEPMFVTSQNTKPDEIIIEDKPKRNKKIITPEITEIKINYKK